MRLLNYTTAYLAGIFLLVIALWATIFYFSMLDEIYDSIDDGLDNQKGLIIQKAAVDSSILIQSSFEEKDYQITEIPASQALHVYDSYSDTSMYMQNEDDFEPVRLLKTVFQQGGHYYQLVVTTSMVEEDDLRRQLLLGIIWLYAGLVILVLLLNNQLLKRIWKPFYHLLAQLGKFRVDKPIPDVRTNTKVEEFSMLGNAVQNMMERNAETFISQKQFIENAAHELQTPLAVSINKLESLAEISELNPKQAELVSTALESLERMTRMNKSLLLLSRIENKQFHEVSDVHMNTIVKKVAADFADQAGYRGIKLSLQEEADCRIRMNEELGLILATNLIKNAIVHTPEGGEVTIRIRARELVVSNPGNAGLDMTSLFTRFQPGRAQGSTGLGLAIAKAICTLYNCDIQYRFENKQHFMILKFPG